LDACTSFGKDMITLQAGMIAVSLFRSSGQTKSGTHRFIEVTPKVTMWATR